MHQTLLLKDPPRSKVHRFRNITLVEADLMFVMKDVWARRLGGRIHTDGTLNEAQYARKGQVPQNGVLNKRMSYNLQHVLRKYLSSAARKTPSLGRQDQALHS